MCVSNIGTIELKGMHFFAYHGVLPEERRGNVFIVDFSCDYNISTAMCSDDVSDTLDYGSIYDIIAEEMVKTSNLLEHVAGRIATHIERVFPQIINYSVSIAKQNPPVNGKVDWSKVTVKGGKGE